MAGYFNSAGSSIGSLLRFIQEQKSGSPISAPSAQSGSPIRDVTQNPLQGSEGIGSARVASLKPEGVLTPSGAPIDQGVAQRSRIGEITIGGGELGTAQKSGGLAGSILDGVGNSRMAAPSQATTNPAFSKQTPSSPSISTSIKPTPVGTPTPGMQNIQANLSRGISGADMTSQKIKDAISAGDRSMNDFDARQAAMEAEQAKANAEYAAKEAHYTGKDIISGKEKAPPEMVASLKEKLGQVLGTQIKTGPTPMSVGRGVEYNKPTLPLNYTPATPVNITPATKGLTVQTPQKAPVKAPSLGTSIGNALATLRKMFGF